MTVNNHTSVPAELPAAAGELLQGELQKDVARMPWQARVAVYFTAGPIGAAAAVVGASDALPTVGRLVAAAVGVGCAFLITALAGANVSR